MTAPPLAAPFRWEGEHVTIDLGTATALFTTRRGGVSAGPFASLNLGLWTADERANVLENRSRAAAAAGVGPERFAQGRQVHGAAVRTVVDPADTAQRPDGDGQLTTLSGVAPIVLVADCIPVAVAGDGAVAMLHCGWRGLAGGIVAAGVAALHAAGARAPFAAALGPGAGGCCYEAGPEVHDAFSDHPGAHDRALLDLPAVARAELLAAGVDDVHDLGACTLCGDPELWFSHRRDGGVTGRQAGIAWLS